MMLRPQDVVLLLKLIALHGRRGRFLDLAASLSQSVSETHKGFGRIVAARLVDAATGVPIKSAAVEFLVHGVKYVFPAQRGGLTRGMPTGFAAPPLSTMMTQDGVTPPVWPDTAGSTRGYALKPFFAAVPAAAQRDPALYELLALIDAIRDGGARERLIAADLVRKRIAGEG